MTTDQGSSATATERSFAEIDPALTEAEALAEANRCLFCYDAPCITACPTHIDVPSFIKKIANGNLTGSARVILDANPIGATCARVCPVEVLCEGACVEKTRVNRPIEIGRLQRYAIDHGGADAISRLSKREPNGRRIAVIGSGPAGLSCAAYLARLGYGVTVFERREKPGGLNTYGMAEYKMTQDDALREAAAIAELGIEFRLDCEVGREISLADIETQYDAVFIGIGLSATRRLDVPGEDLLNVVDALSFIEQVKTRNRPLINVGRTVVVIGAGNTAVDAATQAKRLGAERVIMAYRRGETDAPAYDYELELARRDGVEFLWHATPLAFIGQGRIETAVFQRADGSRVEVVCDMAIKAIGQEKFRDVLTNVVGIDVDDSGKAVVTPNLQTSRPHIFAGGDCVNGGGEAVEAAQMGKHAASGIHQFLTGETVVFSGSDKML